MLTKIQRNRLRIYELQVNHNALEQCSRKNSLEFHNIPEDINIPTNEIICKIAQAAGVGIELDDIEISHYLYHKKGNKPIIAKFTNQGELKTLTPAPRTTH